MADFDFDELDRAVTGALGGDEPTQLPTEAPIQSTVEPVPPVSPTPSPASVPATRRSTGRFMDVVHPSSDMRNGDARTQAPVNSSNLRSQAPVQPVESSVVPSDNPTEQPVSPTVDAPDSGDDWAKPLESPFIPDAKVEKRPLGGTPPSEADFNALELLEVPDEPRIEAHTMPDPIDFAQQGVAEPLAEEVPVTQDVVDPQPEVVEQEPQPDTPPVAMAYGEGSFQEESQTEVSAGPTSISPQYQEQPSSTPVGTSTIYDTEAYQQPASVAPKKKSGVMVIVWILLLVVLGGGAGAAVYFYVLPML